MDELRRVCAEVSERARSVALAPDAIAAYATALELPERFATDANEEQPHLPDREQLAAFWLTLDAVNFGSGWFPTLHKRDGLSGYGTVAAALRDHVGAQGAWTAAQLTGLDAATVARTLGQPSGHELMGLYASSLTDLGAHVEHDHGGSFSAFVDAADGSGWRSPGGWAGGPASLTAPDIRSSRSRFSNVPRSPPPTCSAPGCRRSQTCGG